MPGQLNVHIDKRSGFKTVEIRKIFKYITETLAIEYTDFSISLINDAALRSLNKEHLNHDYETDILTFDYRDEITAALDGEIIISYETAGLNAEKFGCSLREEIIRLLIHGVLHLSGYDDKTPEQKKKMKLKEDQLLKKAVEELQERN